MYKRLFQAEFLKIKRKWVWFLIALGPIGVVGLQALNFTLRYDWLTKQYADDLWGGLLGSVGALAFSAIVLGMAIITSILANIEHAQGSWKQLLATPIRKSRLFLTKFTVGWLLLLISCVLLMIGTIILGLALGFGADIPWHKLLITSFYPYFAALPILALQIWLAIVFKNQGVALTIGIIILVFSMYGGALPNWFPLTWPTLQAYGSAPIINVWLGIGLALVLLIFGTIDFVRRDVHNG